MATKTISIDLEAYERLRSVRRSPGDSFSKVIKRAVWPPAPRTAAAMLAALDGMPVMSETELDRLDAAQLADPVPDDRWHGS
ncbi:MAG: antitoxin VapB family protein [Spirochaetaceae bacterium]|nr:antitoxin VapB family protein [Spirochaetaceae bacterium]